MEKIERYKGCLLGLACGDAIGTTVEFRPRGTFRPVTDMVGGGPFKLRPGQWTDDTSMALCLASSLISNQGFDAYNVMMRFRYWMENGYLSSTGSCFDIGVTVRTALSSFRKTDEPFSGPTDKYSAGNGCLMRLAPIPMMFHEDLSAVIEMSAQSSRLTHGAQECVESTQLFGIMLSRALGGETKESITRSEDLPAWKCENVEAIAAGRYKRKKESEIRGSGYVIASLEAALWCFVNTSTFEEAILRAANLGDDADTTAAICGQLAGAYYGVGAIPTGWLEKLAMRDEISEMADELARASALLQAGRNC